MDLARPGNGRLLCAVALAAVGAFAVGLSVAQAGDEQRFPSDGVAPRAACDSLKSLTLPNGEIISATAIVGPTNYCAVVGVVNQRTSAQDPDHFTYGIGFQINLPNVWRGRFELIGGGGTDGSLRNPIGGAGGELASGWVVAANDGGHEDALPNAFGWIDDDNNRGGTAHFGIDEQAREDYGFNACPIWRTAAAVRRRTAMRTIS